MMFAPAGMWRLQRRSNSLARPSDLFQEDSAPGSAVPNAGRLRIGAALGAKKKSPEAGGIRTERRKFLGRSMAGGIALGGAAAARAQRSELPSKFTPAAHSLPHSDYSPFTTPDYFTYADNLVIERDRPGRPHRGKVLA